MSWWPRHGDAPDDRPAELTGDRIRAAIGELAERRDEAALAASAALLGQVEVQHAIREQHRQLHLALLQLDDALALARRVADEIARDDGELAALPFRANVDGLGFQRDVIVSAIGQLDALRDVSQSQVGAAREVVIRSRAVFDEALHEQLRLLVRLEQLERARLLLAARAGSRPAGRAGVRSPERDA